MTHLCINVLLVDHNQNRLKIDLATPRYLRMSCLHTLK
uniref:Uncharacterized protein n=1 Tax=Aegilops tauschii subsp. strangulata TaxID=200361 RepID=A0A453QT30_AEGTS